MATRCCAQGTWDCIEVNQKSLGFQLMNIRFNVLMVILKVTYPPNLEDAKEHVCMFVWLVNTQPS